jgi:hypothetical protein
MERAEHPAVGAGRPFADGGARGRWRRGVRGLGWSTALRAPVRPATRADPTLIPRGRTRRRRWCGIFLDAEPGSATARRPEVPRRIQERGPLRAQWEGAVPHRSRALLSGLSTRPSQRKRSMISSPTPPEHDAARRWVQLLSVYREPSLRRSPFELGVSLVPFVGLWALAWWSLSISPWLAAGIALLNGGFLGPPYSAQTSLMPGEFRIKFDAQGTAKCRKCTHGTCASALGRGSSSQVAKCTVTTSHRKFRRPVMA